MNISEQWILKSPCGKSYRFKTKPNNPGEIAIFWTRVGSKEDSFMSHCLINKARRMWDDLIKEGCVQR